MFTILDVDVPRGMLLVYEEHPDDDSIETADFRHAAVVWLAFSSPNVGVNCRVLASGRYAPR